MRVNEKGCGSLRTAPLFACAASTTLRGVEPESVNKESINTCKFGNIEGGAESGALYDDLLIIPPDLARLVGLWDSLPDTVKGEIIALAESSADLSEFQRHKTT